MNVALLMITDGRWDYLTASMASAYINLDYPFAQRILVDDTGERARWREEPGWDYVKNPERLGLAGAIGAGWNALRPDIDFVFHLEDDFTFPSAVDVEAMVCQLAQFPHVAQVALLRQPWSPDEVESGGIFGCHPDWPERDGLVWQQDLFTFNPCVYPRWVTDYGAGLERDLTDKLLVDGWWFTYYGTRDDGPRCWHIGERRSVGHRW